MSEWEQEPWREDRYSGGAPHEIDIASVGPGWFMRASPGYPFDDFPNPAEAEKDFRANVARFIACVNALQGIEDPAAFMREVREVLGLIVSDTKDFVIRGGVSRSRALLDRMGRE